MELSQAIFSVIVILVGAKLFGELAERIGQPPVLGELIAGVVLGGSALGLIRTDQEFLVLLAEFGAILLLFEVGLDSDLEEYLRVGLSAFAVACVGVIGPFTVGYLVSRLFGVSSQTAIFIGATLTATSVGITARTLTDLGEMRTAEAKIILGAAVIDDVLGLIILAVVVGLVQTHAVSVWQISQVTILAIVFLVGAIILGIPIAPHMLKVARSMRTRGMLTVSAFVFCMLLAYVSGELKLAPIVGAFAAGLVLAKTQDQAHIQERIKPLADILVPVFFVIIGARVNLQAINPFAEGRGEATVFVLGLIAVAVVTKLFAGLGVLRRRTRRLVVGIGMIPRGEVGLIFATMGLNYKVIDSVEYAGIVAVVVVTTFITPPLLKSAFARGRKKAVPAPEAS